LNLLFICSRNQWRSPTAEQIWRNEPGFSVRSRGTSSNARRKVSADDVTWADVIFVMEEKHQRVLTEQFSRELRDKLLHVLDIPDDYRYMDPDLVEELKAAIEPLLVR
jgi:predicted protein tyrosine phosphatase